MKLSANTVVFVFNIQRAWKCRKDFIFCIGGSGEHEFHRAEHAKGDLVELAAPGEYGGFADVPEYHVCPANGFDRPLKSPGDRFFDCILLQTDTQIAGNDLDDIFGLGRSESAK